MKFSQIVMVNGFITGGSRQMNAPRTPFEFRCIALKAIKLEDCADPETTLAALDEVVLMMERVYTGEQLAPTPCQKFMGRVFVAAIEEYLASHQFVEIADGQV